MAVLWGSPPLTSNSWLHRVVVQAADLLYRFAVYRVVVQAADLLYRFAVYTFDLMMEMYAADS